MGNVRWVGGRQQARAQVETVTIGSNTAAQTFPVKIGRKTVTYTAGTGESTTTVAQGLWALLDASTEGEFAEVDWGDEPAAAVITATGPADGAPITLVTTGGTGTISHTTTVAPLSPYDANDAANFDGNALPSADVVYLDAGAVPMRYNLDVAGWGNVTAIHRRATYSGAVGLPDANPAGYEEYRVRRLTPAAATVVTVRVEQSANTGAFRLDDAAAGGAVTVQVTGDGTGGEPADLTGLPASSVVNVAGGSVILAPLVSDTCTVLTFRGSNSSVEFGPGLTLSGTATLVSCTGVAKGSWTALSLNGGSLDVLGAATGPLTIDGGTVRWRSTGAVATGTVIGSGGVLDFTLSPQGVAMGGAVSLYAGATFWDPAGRVTTPYTLTYVRCSMEEVSVNVGTAKSLAVS